MNKTLSFARVWSALKAYQHALKLLESLEDEEIEIMNKIMKALEAEQK